MKKRRKCADRKRAGWIAGGVLAAGAVTGGILWAASGEPRITAEELTEQYIPEESVRKCEQTNGAQPGDALRQDEAFASAYTDFSLELLRQSRMEAGGGNVMVSPLSVMLALEMTRSGAGGETLAQMDQVLYPGLGGDLGKKGICAWQDELEKKESGDGGNRKGEGGLSLANSIWLHTGDFFTPEEDFLKGAAEDYGARIYGAPFDRSTCTDINRWVAYETNGQVGNILDYVPEDAILYLVNAAAFEGAWCAPYETSEVKERTFHNADGTDAMAFMMYSMEHLYLQADGVTGFAKPYEQGYHFAALLPDEDSTLEEYIGELDGATLLETITDMNDTMVSAGLPKFRGDTALELSDVLGAMGMPLAFDEELADFHGMGSMADGGNICISRVLHRTHIEVNEDGTKAAAAAVVEMMTEGAAEVEEVKTVILNRPFLYAIIEDETGLPIFIGTVEKMQGMTDES